MTRPRLLDLCCKAGGATKGYQRAGFYVVGVDIEPQPNYCGDEFIQADVLELDPEWLNTFKAAHASPPCQRHSKATRQWDPTLHPDLVEPVREHLIRAGIPYVIENVPGAPLRADLMLCGSQFSLGVRRHRIFESNVPLSAPWAPCDHSRRAVQVNGHPGGRSLRDGPRHTTAEWRTAMGIDWMTARELAEAIPPAYTEHIGAQLMAHLARPSPTPAPAPTP